MRLVGVAVAGLLFGSRTGVGAIHSAPRDSDRPASAYDVAEIVQAMGLDPIGPPMRSGAFYVQRARDDFGRVLRVTVDARRSQVVAVEARRTTCALRASCGLWPRTGGPIRVMRRFLRTTTSIWHRPGRSWRARVPATAAPRRTPALAPNPPSPPHAVAPRPIREVPPRQRPCRANAPPPRRRRPPDRSSRCRRRDAAPPAPAQPSVGQSGDAAGIDSAIRR